MDLVPVRGKKITWKSLIQKRKRKYQVLEVVGLVQVIMKFQTLLVKSHHSMGKWENDK
jgi:hypothetical protein